MAFIRLSRFKASAEVVSSILNWVCPECGGRMGGRGSEFQCQGECQMDWRQFWERSRSGAQVDGVKMSPDVGIWQTAGRHVSTPLWRQSSALLRLRPSAELVAPITIAPQSRALANRLAISM